MEYMDRYNILFQHGGIEEEFTVASVNVRRTAIDEFQESFKCIAEVETVQGPRSHQVAIGSTFEYEIGHQLDDKHDGVRGSWRMMQAFRAIAGLPKSTYRVQYETPAHAQS